MCDDVCSVSASACMSARPECRWAMPAGSCTVWSTASSPTVRCRATRLSAEVTTRSTRSSARPEPASTCREPSLSTLSPLSSVSMPLLSNAAQLWGHVNEVGASTEMNGGHYITNDLTFGQKSFYVYSAFFVRIKCRIQSQCMYFTITTDTTPSFFEIVLFPKNVIVVASSVSSTTSKRFSFFVQTTTKKEKCCTDSLLNPQRHSADTAKFLICIDAVCV